MRVCLGLAGQTCGAHLTPLTRSLNSTSFSLQDAEYILCTAPHVTSTSQLSGWCLDDCSGIHPICTCHHFYTQPAKAHAEKILSRAHKTAFRSHEMYLMGTGTE